MSTWSFIPKVNGKYVLDKDGKEVKIDVDIEADPQDITVEAAVDGELIKPNYLLPDAVYNVLKWVALLLLPTCAWLITALSDVWGIPMASQISMTLNIIGTFIAALIGVSALQNQR